MDQKEAMPKAAFQYGVKMTEGRKTRTTKANAGPMAGARKVSSAGICAASILASKSISDPRGNLRVRDSETSLGRFLSFQDKMKLDRELQQINQILAKRKAGDGDKSSKHAKYDD